MPVSNTEISQDDLKDPSLTVLNQVIRDLTQEVQRLGGYLGPISLNNDLDLAGHKIKNQAK